MWVRIIASEEELELLCYKHIVSGQSYRAIYTKGGGNLYYDIFFNERCIISGVYKGRLRELGIDEIREEKLKELDIMD